MSLSNDKNLSKLGYLDELDNSDLLKRGLCTPSCRRGWGVLDGR